MSRPRKANVITEMANEITARAGYFLDANLPGPSKDKRLAQLLGISPDMAGLLRRGRGWTIARLEQVRRIYGAQFDQMVFGIPARRDEVFSALAELRAEIAQTREEIADVASRLAHVPMASMAGEATQRAGEGAQRASDAARQSRGGVGAQGRPVGSAAGGVRR